MTRPELFSAYHAMNEEGNPSEGVDRALSLRKFVESYAVSLPALVRAFPKNNLDIKALEAHYWDRLKEFYKYESFGDVSIETKEEIEFVNTTIREIEQWFYKGEWTSCIVLPSDEEIEALVGSDQPSFLKRLRRPGLSAPNLGRDGRYHGRSPLPDIYDDASGEDDLWHVYSDHAFKFFQGPAAVTNTLTKIRGGEGIVADAGKYTSLLRDAHAHAISRYEEWGYSNPRVRNKKLPDAVSQVEKSFKYLDGGSDLPQFQQTLYLIKSAMAAAELIREQQEDGLTQEGFEFISQWIIDEVAKQSEERQRAVRNIRFDFVSEGNGKRKEFAGSSIVHIDSKELPAAVLIVDYLQRHSK